MNNKNKPDKGVNRLKEYYDNNKQYKAIVEQQGYRKHYANEEFKVFSKPSNNPNDKYKYTTPDTNQIQSYAHPYTPPVDQQGGKESFFMMATRWVMSTRLRPKLVKSWSRLGIYIDNLIGIGRAVAITDYFFPRNKNKCCCSACERYRKENKINI